MFLFRPLNHSRVLLKRSSSVAVFARREEDVVRKLKDVVDPATNKSIDSLGILQGVKVTNGDQLKVSLDFFVPGYPHRNEILLAIESKLKELDWLTKAPVFAFEEPKKCSSLNSVSIEPTSLSSVGHIIGVSSCKGGVGKSTVAANLAVSLSKMGLKVGILDADIYGPSLPILLPEASSQVLRSPLNAKHVLPLRSLHCPELKMLSFGHVNPKSGAPGAGGKAAAVVRGPIASRIINQLLLATDWGDLDYLVVDMPPGTGDVQITLSQSACMSGAVLVTTPHALSLVDAAKGVAMFEEMKVPTLAVVENMSYFTCDAGKKYYPFGRGGRENLLRGCRSLLRTLDAASTPDTSANTAGASSCGSSTAPAGPHTHAADGSCQPATTPRTVATTSDAYVRLQHCPLHTLPIYSPASSSKEEPEHHDASLLPVSITEPASNSAQIYRDLARDVVVEVFRNQISTLLVPSLSYSKTKGELLLRYFTASKATEYAIPVEELRIRDPMTGLRRAEDKATTSEEAKQRFKDIFPTKLDHKGLYGVAIVWNDGHFADIYPYDTLRSIAEEIAANH